MAAPDLNITCLSEMWSAYLGRSLDEQDIVVMLIQHSLAQVADGGDRTQHWSEIERLARRGLEIAGSPDWRLDMALQQYVEPVPEESETSAAVGNALSPALTSARGAPDAVASSAPALTFKHRKPAPLTDPCPRVARFIAALDAMSNTWSAVDDAKLSELQALGDSISTIARALGRKPDDVRKRWRELTAMAREGAPAITDAALNDLQRAVDVRASRKPDCVEIDDG